MKNDIFFNSKNIDLGRKNSSRWVEDSFSAPESLATGGNAGFLSLSLTDKKIKIFYLLLLLGLAALFCKSFYLQIIRGGYYFSLAEENRTKVEYTPADRGIIYDRNGAPLVQNVFGFSLSIISADLPKDKDKKEGVLNTAASLAGITRAELDGKLKDSSKYYYQSIVIKTGIGYEQAMALKIISSDMPGVYLDIDSWRQYLAGPSCSHLLGYVGKISSGEYDSNKSNYLLSDNMGKAGLEKQYESYLKGQHGQKKIEVDALGREKKVISQTSYIAGASLILSLDAGLQNKIYGILTDKVKDGRAVVVVSNPQTGEILAMVDYPSYDNNLFAQGIKADDYKKLLDDQNKPLFTRSIFGEYPSGSTIKPTIAAAALQEKIITRNTTVNSTGGLKVKEWFFPDWKAGGHGATNVIKALAQSVNTFFYYVGGGYGDFKGLGVDLLVKYFRLFGLGEPTGIDLPGERGGFVPTPQWKEETKKEQWYIGDTYHISIGQGDLLVTPLQVNSWTATVANGGKIMRPRLALGVARPDGSKEFFPPQITRENFISAENINIVREGMRETVKTGSARSLNDLKIAVAGKTGTAQWSTTKKNHAWFTAFAPYDNPTFAVTVLVEEGGEGSVVATPIAKEILQYWFK